jgi:hypothetical protein
MDAVGVDRVHGRRIRLFQLSGWVWEEPLVRPFVLLIAAHASCEDEVEIRRFAAAAIESGCGYICAWGDGCELVHDVFDDAAIAVDRFVMSTWHADESLPNALYFALTNAFLDDDEFPDAAEAAIVLAVEEPWVEDARRLVADQDELARLWLAEEK